ncbi:MAG: DUF3892 domain-containing protein [Pseudomonadota bacterium]|nr:DUF3892 domain-containing protein [Pseudomonadota bacterium]
MAEYQITAVRMSNNLLGSGHEHITDVMLSDGLMYAVALVINLIKAGHTFIVTDGFRTVAVGVVPAEGLRREYIRTYADGIWSDNLLALRRV